MSAGRRFDVMVIVAEKEEGKAGTDTGTFDLTATMVRRRTSRGGKRIVTDWW